MKFILCVALTLLASPLFAQEIKAVNVTGLQGTYILTVNGDAVTIAPLKLYSLTPGPTPTPTPVPPVITQRIAAIRDAAARVTGDANRNQTSEELATLYGEIAKKVRTGEIPAASVTTAMKAGADMLLTSKGVAAQWQPVRDVISSQLAAVIQEGGTAGQLANLLDDVAVGLRATLQGQQPQAINIELILKIVMLILEMLKQNPMSVR